MCTQSSSLTSVKMKRDWNNCLQTSIVLKNNPQTWELSQFCNNECSVPLCKHSVSTVEYTYASVCNGTRCHIDHIFVTSNLEQFIVKYDVVDN